MHSAHFNPEDFPSQLGGSGWSWLSATQEFRAAYDPDDKRIAGTFIESYPTGRLGLVNGAYPIFRWSATADYNLSRFGGVVRADADPNNPNQMVFRKAWSAKLTELDKHNSQTEKNTVYIRLADILLGHAEACNESGQGDPLVSINTVRQRAGLSPLEGMNQAQLRDAIIHERMQEHIIQLKLDDTQITDSALLHIGKLPVLQQLHLENTAVGDAGLAHLSACKQLRYLNLVNTQVTDEGLGMLAQLPALQTVYLYQSAVSGQGLAKLGQARPEVQIDTGNYRLPALPTDTIVY